MRKKTIFLMMALALASTPAMLAQEAADTTFVFKDIKVNPTTSVKDQNKSGTCWSFAHRPPAAQRRAFRLHAASRGAPSVSSPEAMTP